jgi:hypothetical protein
MLVPHTRGSAWLLELGSCSAADEAVDAVEARGVAVHTPEDRTVRSHPSGPELDRELERLAASAQFRRYLAEVEGALARRTSLGLPELLARPEAVGSVGSPKRARRSERTPAPPRPRE